MIPDIGVMVGAYIVTRMLELARTSSHSIVRIFSVLTLLTAVVAIVDLILRGTTGIELRDFTQ